jgi:hypothetical protein
MLEQIQDKSLKKLEGIAVAWTLNTSVEQEVEREALSTGAVCTAVARQGSIQDVFTQLGRAVGRLRDRGERNNGAIIGSPSSGSRFSPSCSSGSL